METILSAQDFPEQENPARVAEKWRHDSATATQTILKLGKRGVGGQSPQKNIKLTRSSVVQDFFHPPTQVALAFYPFQ